MNTFEWMKTLKLDELYDLLDGINQEKDKRVEAIIMRTFDTGATRDSDDEKFDYEGFLSPLVLKRFAEYMNEHRVQADGCLRDSDNWQKGIPMPQYMKSAWRHFMSWWCLHRECADLAPINELSSAPMSLAARQELEESVCALLFNAMGYLHELLQMPVQTEAVSMDKILQSQFHVDICPTAHVNGLIDGQSGRLNENRYDSDQRYRDGYIIGQKLKRLREQV